MPDARKTDFEKAGEQGRDAGMVREFIAFLLGNKKWWLLPIILVMLVFGALIILGGSGAAPFIYTLF